MNTQMKLSKVQHAIQKIIEVFITEADQAMEYSRNDRLSNCNSLMYCFKNKKSINVDGDLYDILLYGQADYDFGSKLYKDIHKKVNDLGYYLEYEGQGIYNIERN